MAKCHPEGNWSILNFESLGLGRRGLCGIVSLWWWQHQIAQQVWQLLVGSCVSPWSSFEQLSLQGFYPFRQALVPLFFIKSTLMMNKNCLHIFLLVLDLPELSSLAFKIPSVTCFPKLSFLKCHLSIKLWYLFFPSDFPWSQEECT